MQTLELADPCFLSADIGPVINDAALRMLRSHAEHIKTRGKLIYQMEVPEGLTGHYFGPLAVEINDLSVLTQEVFGPVLHVIRYDADQLDQVLAQIKATGYGLTMGIHSRIEETVRYIYERSDVGNTYVNRNMIGAVVGVQPFGGTGLSGTGPKAGGPHYLRRLCVCPAEWVSSIDHGLRVVAPDPVPKSTNIDLDHALDALKASENLWRNVSIHDRIKICARVADLFMQNKAQFIQLLNDQNYAQNLSTEVKQVQYQSALEALRFYTVEAERNLVAAQILPGPTGELNKLALNPRGIVLCITPWYSPLLASTGNRVVIKPAQQSSNLVLALVELFYQAGVPKTVLQILTGSGSDLGATLLRRSEVNAVMFTGAVQTAQAIRKTLAERDGSLVPLILEEDARCYIERLTIERTLSINTTANGGNASLLSFKE